VTGRCGTVLVPDTTLDQAVLREFDLIVLPGGAAGADRLENDARVVGLLKDMALRGKYVAAICAAPKVLAAAGLLDGKRATCYPGALDVKKYPRIRLENRATVIDGKVLTSRGPGTAMDFALELIRTLSGRQTRDKVEAELARPPEQALAQLADWG
jgi:4-methyl-5(b-hydroxyethyl)-thiazole monophosphate biosynthesis